MYRLSTGLKYSGATEKAISYLVFQSDKDIGQRYFDQELWKYEGERPKGTRVYTSTFYGRIELFKKPLKEERAKQLFQMLDSISPEEKHPALENGFKSEAKRLFSSIDENVLHSYFKFIDFLNETYQIEDLTKSETELSSYSDDIGPFVMGKVGDRSFLLPEFSKLYLAPSIWRSITWFIHNYLAGPYPKDPDFPDLEHFQWNKLKLPQSFNSPYCEGLAYFLIANFIIIYEAFSENPTCNSLQLYIDLIQNQGERPWQKLF